ncbi:balbiani ring protein 3 [Orussus abietinus]|uniref:balbiani ring protein 3 n=1 Tax=Orussus abietinus TaxID=222816 RepID=UPI000625384B|nr:balbiani ring protein 3 [Orussus abietinus]
MTKRCRDPQCPANKNRCTRDKSPAKEPKRRQDCPCSSQGEHCTNEPIGNPKTTRPKRSRKALCQIPEARPASLTSCPCAKTSSKARKRKVKQADLERTITICTSHKQKRSKKREERCIVEEKPKKAKVGQGRCCCQGNSPVSPCPCRPTMSTCETPKTKSRSRRYRGDEALKKKRKGERPAKSKGILWKLSCCRKAPRSKDSEAPCGRYLCRYNPCRKVCDEPVPCEDCSYNCRDLASGCECTCGDRQVRTKLPKECAKPKEKKKPKGPKEVACPGKSEKKERASKKPDSPQCTCSQPKDIDVCGGTEERTEGVTGENVKGAILKGLVNAKKELEKLFTTVATQLFPGK